MHKFCRLSLAVAAAVAFTFCGTMLAQDSPNVVVQWNQAALQGVRDGTLGPPMVARALFLAHECMYDAWSAYDYKAIGTLMGRELRRPGSERTLDNKNKAISFAAYRALANLMPWDLAKVFAPLMARLGYDPADTTTDTSTPQGIGNVACAAVLASRQQDGSNQLNNYVDNTGYVSVNPPSTVPVDWRTIVDPDRWSPLVYTNPAGVLVTQKFLGAQWYKVTPFALTSSDQFIPFVSVFGPARYGSEGYVEQAVELINFSAQLTDEQKMIAEYWANGPHSETPPGHWDLFGQFVSARDHHTVDEDAKMFFALNAAEHDAAIAAWTAKRVFDSVRPAAAIPYLFHGQLIASWGGPGQGTVLMDAANWIPYQDPTFPTPPFPEYISGHSTFSAAGAAILALWTGSDDFGDSVSFAAGSSSFEPGFTPQSPVTMSWSTFSEAADQAGISRRYGGIHFKRGDLVGRAVGRLVAQQVWDKALIYFTADNGAGDDDQSDTRHHAPGHSR